MRLAPGLKVAVVLGDDVYPRIDEFLAKGYEMRDMDTGEPLAAHPRPHPERQRLHRRVPAGRGAGHRRRRGDRRPLHRHRAGAGAHGPPLRLEADEYDKLAAGTIAGHIIECGAQCTGGNCQVDWQNIPDMANIGYPIVEAEPDGTFVRHQAPGTGGRVTLTSVKEQLLYELGDPKNYITPDCIADFTSIRLADDGPDRVRVTRHSRRPAPAIAEALDQLRQRLEGDRHAGLYLAAGAREGAGRRRASCASGCSSLGLAFDEIYTEYLRRQRLPRRRPRRPIPTRPKCSCASACAGRTRRRWTGSPAS